MNTKQYLICYDVADQKRLARVRKIAYSYAIGGQKSAIEAPMSESKAVTVFEKLKKELKEKEDKLNIIEIYDNPILFGKAFRLVFDESGSIVL